MLRKILNWVRASRKALVPILGGLIAIGVQEGSLEITGEPLIEAERWFDAVVYFLVAIGVYQATNTPPDDADGGDR